MAKGVEGCSVLPLFLSPNSTVHRIVTCGLGPLSLCSTGHVPFLAKPTGIFGGASHPD